MLRDVGVAVLAVVAVGVPGAAEARTVRSPPSPRIPRGRLVDATSILSPSAWRAGQIVSNCDDVAAFLAALMHSCLLRPSLLAAMKTRVPGHDYGLGLIIADTPCGKRANSFAYCAQAFGRAGQSGKP